jgi:hypothetical protein
MRPTRASVLVVLAFAVAACAGPMTLREAKERAQDRMTRYCDGKCAAMQLTGAQKIKDRWLVDFDTAARKYTIAVDEGGNTQLSIWDKAQGAAAR